MIVAVNYLAVLVAAVAAYAVGAVWYSPIGFGKQWKKLMGLSNEDMRRMPLTMQQAMAIGFIFTLLMSYVLAHFEIYLRVSDIPNALALGFWVWLGFGVMVLSYSWTYEGKSFKLFLFNAAHLLIATEVMAAVLSLWR